MAPERTPNPRASGSLLADRPPDDFWREVPCGHPADPIAWVNGEGSASCHCGWILDAVPVLDVIDGMRIVPCDKCGCFVGLPKDARG